MPLDVRLIICVKTKNNVAVLYFDKLSLSNVNN